MQQRHRLPDIWTITDARNDARLEALLRNLPRGSGVIFRHYHLNGRERHARYGGLARIARARGHVVVLSGTARKARKWRASGAYGPPAGLSRGASVPRLVTAHSLREIGMARRARADAVFLSPVFASRSHPGGKPLGGVRFRLLARHAAAPVFALGGMNRRRARGLGWNRWAAIDGI